MQYGWQPHQLTEQENNLAKWLMSQGNLTQKLQKLGEHRLALIDNNTCHLPKEEAKLLKQKTDNGYARHIIHYVDERPVVCARTVISDELYQQNKQELDALGIHPIGQTLLYNKSNIARSAFEYGLVSSDSFLMQHFPLDFVGNTENYARRSSFSIDDKLLVITEIFLPVMNKYALSH